MTERLDIAVIGHTNAGKTSLMRTLTRRRDFGEVSAHPATTRHVEMAELALGGQTVMRLFDTPGFEDSSGLLAHIETLRAAHGQDWIETIEAFAGDPDLQAGFTQEAKALGQILASAVLLYVIDVRDPVRAKHRDELELLGRCARPVLPVLNFVAPGDTRDGEFAATWRDQLARVNMHALVAFDTVVYNQADELTLYAKIAILADRFAPMLTRLSDELATARQAQQRASAVMVAELIVDIAGARRPYKNDDEAAKTTAATDLKNAVRTREQQAVTGLLQLNRFGEEDYTPAELPFSGGAWHEDLFDPLVLERFGFDTSKALAAGASAGLAIDLMTGGLTLGAAALTGAAVGFAIDSARRYGGRLIALATGIADMAVDEPTLKLIIDRETALTAALFHRGHGAQAPIAAAPYDGAPLADRLAGLIHQARRHPNWSSLAANPKQPPPRAAVVTEIANAIEAALSSGEPQDQESIK
ncbi:MAG: GTPase/DUF3482 domain-containing protein [Alphaproteobacteria bacterium]